MFYVLLAAVVVTAVSALGVFGRAVDAANAGGEALVGRIQSAVLAAFLALLVLAAAFVSPLA